MTRPMTMAEKILAAHAGLPEVVPGQLVECNLDLVLANDITAPIAIKTVNEIGAGVFDRDRICLVPDHYSPNKDIKSAEQTKVTRDFAHEHKITNYFEQGCMGIEHALLPEQGVVVPGDLMIGADSHTCTYGAHRRVLHRRGLHGSPAWAWQRAAPGSRFPRRSASSSTASFPPAPPARTSSCTSSA